MQRALDDFFYGSGVMAWIILALALAVLYIDNRSPMEILSCLDRSALYSTTH